LIRKYRLSHELTLLGGERLEFGNELFGACFVETFS
jgi:hypothetical protein